MAKYNFDALRRMLPGETFNTLFPPSKDELTQAGQRELPFGPGDETDFVPQEVVQEEQMESLPRGFMSWLSGGGAPQATSRGPLDEVISKSIDAEYGAALEASAPRKLREQVSTTPTTGIAPPEMVDRLSGVEFDTIYGKKDPPPVEILPGTPELSRWEGTQYRQQGALPPGRDPRAAFLEAPEGRVDPAEQIYRTPRRPRSVLSDPSMEAAVEYGQPTDALPMGRYEEYPLPGGRGAKFVPQDPANELPPMETPGIPLPSLSGMKRELEDLTGEGVAQSLIPTGVPITGRAKLFADALTTRAGIDPGEIQPIWDRISGTNFRDPQGAEREFVKFASAILSTGKGRSGLKYSGDPVEQMRAHFAQAAPIARGNSNEGFGERVTSTNTASLGAQLDEYRLADPAQGFRGSALDAGARQDFNPRERLLDVEEDFVPGNRPLAAARRIPGLTDDPVENLSKGAVDMVVVPKGTLTPGVNRVQGADAPQEMEIVKLFPFKSTEWLEDSFEGRPQMRPGETPFKPDFLKALSRRTGIPVRNLQIMMDSGKEYEIAQVRKPSGKVGKDLPPEGRYRDPKDIAFWDSEAGEAQKGRFEADPGFVEKVLQNPGARAIRAAQGVGKEVLAVVRREGKPFGVVEVGGKKVLKALSRNEKGQLTYQGKVIPANIIERDPTRGELPKPGVTGGTDPRDAAFARSSEGTPPTEGAYMAPPPVEVKGLQLAPKPIREDLSGVKFALARGPRKVIAGGTAALPPVAKDPKKAELTVVFSPRNRPSALGKEFAPVEAGEKELVNPTPEELRDVLLRSNISKVAVRVEEGARRGPAQGAWERAKAILKEVKKPSGKAKALVGAGAVLGVMAGSEEEAEALPRVGKESFELTKAAREAVVPTRESGVGERFVTTQIDQFTPLYEEAKRRLGDDLPLRKVIQTEYGGGMGKAEVEIEPIKLALQDVKKANLEEDFNKFLTWNAGLRQWDMVARRRDKYHTEAANARTAGDWKKAAEYDSRAVSLDNALASKEVVEQGLDKETLTGYLNELHSEVGSAKFSLLTNAAKPIYAATRQKLDELYSEGLLSKEAYQEYLERGDDYIPTWKAPFKVEEDGTVTYTGESLSDPPTGTGLQVREENLVQEMFGSPNVMKDPIDNAVNFISKAEQEINRNRIASEVVKTFSGTDLVIPHKTPPKKLGPGNKLYVFQKDGKPVYHELPAWIVDSLALIDTHLSRELLKHTPGGKILSALRAVPEAGVTTANVGFGAAQAVVIDPITALVQADWANGPLKTLRPYFTIWAKELMKGFLRENNRFIPGAKRFRESSPLRKEAAKAKALYSGATSQILDPRDLTGRKGFSRAKQSLKRGEFTEALQETVGATLHPFTKHIMQPLEEANKLATFGTLRAQGKDSLTAAYETRVYGGSPDWAQRGNWDHALRFLVTFGRPALLGVQTAIRAGKRNPKRLGAVMAGSLGMELARQTVNEQAASELGIPLEELEGKFSEYDKDNTFLVMVPPSAAKALGFSGDQEQLSNGIVRPYAFKHAIPPILRLYMSPFKGIAKAISKDNPLEMPLAVADEMVPGTVPLEGDNIVRSGLRRVGASLPAPLRVPAEQVTNTQFFTGAPIVGSRIEGLPETEQFTESTQPAYKNLGNLLEGVPFLSSPARLQHMGKAFLPGAFEAPIQGLNMLEPDNGIAPPTKGELEGLGDIPLLGPTIFRRLTPQRYEEEMGTSQEQFYGLAGKTKSAAGAINRFLEGTGDLPSELVQALGEANPAVSGVTRELAELSKVRRQIIADPEMTGDEKRSSLQDVTERQREIFRGVLSDPTIKLLLGGEVPR